MIIGNIISIAEKPEERVREGQSRLRWTMTKIPPKLPSEDIHRACNAPPSAPVPTYPVAPTPTSSTNKMDSLLLHL